MEIIKKHDNLFVWVGIAIFCAMIIFQVPISTEDELWNFQNIYKMVNGYTIYKDANVIITPLFFWIGAILFNILGANYFIYRLFDVCIYATMILIVYNILKQLKIEKRRALMYTLIVHYFIYTIAIGGANYNTLAITLVLLGIYITLKYQNTNRFLLLNGIITYFILFTKQNIGAYYMIGTILMQLFIQNKDKKKYTNIVKQIAITALLSILTLGIFVLNGNLIEFINYAFLGIKEFGTNHIAMEIMCIVHLTVAAITIICAILIQKKIANEEQKRNITIFLWIGISMLLIIYPIVNAFHTMLGILVLAVLLMYLADIVIKNFLTTKIVNIVIGFMVVIFALLGVKAGIIIINNNPFTTNYQNPYYGVFVPEETLKKITNVNEYIKQNNEKVIIFSKEAAIYNIPEKRNNGAMDLPFLGNLGYGGEEEMLEKIKSKTGYQILLTKENYWQESEKITNYIREQYIKIGEIEDFEIYQVTSIN